MRRGVFIGPLALLIIWYLLTLFRLAHPLLLPSPIKVGKEFVLMFVSGNIAADLGSTLYRVAIGFVLASLIGIPIGLIMGYSERIYNWCEFLVDFFRSIPATILFPLFMLVFGLGDRAKIAVVVFGCTFLILVNSMYGVRNSKQTRILGVQSMKATKWEIFTKVIFPGALPEIAGGLRISVSIALIIVIVIEMFVGTKQGLGRRISDMHAMFEVAQMYATIILAGIVGYILNQTLFFLERRVIHWAGK